MGARVLVVDDDPWILRMVTATLERRSYVVDTAREGRQALERAHANPPDVIISDVMMPVMDGWTFVQQLRQFPHLCDIPVIFLTALGKDDARLVQLGLNEDDFLAKPFRFDDLEKRLSGALARSTAQQPDSAPKSEPVAAHVPTSRRTPVPIPAPAPMPAEPEQDERVVVSVPLVPPTGPNSSSAPLRRPPTTAEQRPVAAFPSQRRTTALNGRLEQLQLSSLLVMMEMERKDGLLALRRGEVATVGRIFLRAGQVVSAKLDDHDMGGRECVYDMLRWKSGTFSFNAMEVDMEDTVQSSTTHLLMEGARLIDEAGRDEDVF